MTQLSIMRIAWELHEIFLTKMYLELKMNEYSYEHVIIWTYIHTLPRSRNICFVIHMNVQSYEQTIIRINIIISNYIWTANHTSSASLECSTWNIMNHDTIRKWTMTRSVERTMTRSEERTMTRSVKIRWWSIAYTCKRGVSTYIIHKRKKRI